MALSDDDKAEIVAYLDGELDEAATQAIEARIATDPDVRAEVDALKQTWGLLDYLPKANASPSFTHRTMERLTLERLGTSGKTMAIPSTGSSWLTRAGWAAMVLIALGAGYLSTLFFRPSTAPIEPIPDADLPVVRHLRIAEKWRYYESVDDLDFVKKLNNPDLFGEDPG
ncbi:MAG: hypothetical protein HYX68_20785 [Planctomycetes bacterium]|nr:hypothetical protein [Planctomycetota bacterium]